MKATIKQVNFTRALNQVSRVVGTRTTLPVLSNILLSAKKGQITLAATDLEIGIKTTVGGKVETEGELTVPARLLADFIVNNNDDSIEMKATDLKLNLKSAHFEANINGIGADEFPTIPEIPTDFSCRIKKADFIDAVKKVIIAPANDETRPTLAGIYCHFSGKDLVLAATDSYRLAEKKLILETEVPERKMIVPTKTMAEVVRVISSQAEVNVISISAAENQIFFSAGETSLVSRLIEGAFPPYNQIIPRDFKVTAVADSKEFLAGIKMAALFAKDAANNIRVTTKKTELVVNSALAQSGDATSRVSAEVSGEEMEIAFNARYLIDALGAVSSKNISLKLNDGSSSGVLGFDDDRDYLYIVMPLKIDN
ncbi:MAG: DNA polymerase III subunit beta [Patescibacteria group bacterium]